MEGFHFLPAEINQFRIPVFTLLRPIQKQIKMGCIELDGGIHTGQSQTSTEIPIGFCIDLWVSVSVSWLIHIAGSGLGSLLGLGFLYFAEISHWFGSGL